MEEFLLGPLVEQWLLLHSQLPAGIHDHVVPVLADLVGCAPGQGAEELTAAVISSQARCQASVFLYQPLLGIEMSLRRLNSSRMRNFSSSENLMCCSLAMLMLPLQRVRMRMSRGALMLSTTPSPCLGHVELGLRHCLGLSKTGSPWGHWWWCVPWAPQTQMPSGVPRCRQASVRQIARGTGSGHILIHAGEAPVQGGSAGCWVFTCLSAACSHELGCTRGAGCS